ncbi:hypothetical protein OG604_25690 [Streptomyces sp. NBC_01231]|nr:hypothetical protein OG604_25690 [Streptomyces sp. NBC_01231]
MKVFETVTLRIFILVTSFHAFIFDAEAPAARSKHSRRERFRATRMYLTGEIASQSNARVMQITTLPGLIRLMIHLSSALFGGWLKYPPANIQTGGRPHAVNRHKNGLIPDSGALVHPVSGMLAASRHTQPQSEDWLKHRRLEFEIACTPIRHAPFEEIRPIVQ